MALGTAEATTKTIGKVTERPSPAASKRRAHTCFSTGSLSHGRNGVIKN